MSSNDDGTSIAEPVCAVEQEAEEHLRRTLYEEPSIFRASGPVDFDWGEAE